MSKELNDENFLLDMTPARLTNSEVCVADENAYLLGVGEEEVLRNICTNLSRKILIIAHGVAS